MKKKILVIGALSAITLGFYACEVLEEVGTVMTDGSTGESKLTNAEVIEGLKEALTVGTNNSAGLASKLDGFNNNPLIRLPFPEDAMKVREKAMQLGMTSQVEKFELTLNRAAEEASKEAAPIFVSAVKGMSISDGWNILKGADNAATMYLKEKTTGDLHAAFTPKVQSAIDKVELTKYWEPLAKAYNTAQTFTGGAKVNTDLTKYVTSKATSGLFSLIAGEEKKIRENPVARVNDILKKVFGSLDNK